MEKTTNPMKMYSVPETLHLLFEHPMTKQRFIDIIKKHVDLKQFVDVDSKDEMLYVKSEK